MQHCKKCKVAVYYMSTNKHPYDHETVDRSGLCHSCLEETPAEEVECNPVPAESDEDLICPWCGWAIGHDDSDTPQSGRWEETCEKCNNKFKVEAEYSVTFHTRAKETGEARE